MALELSKTQSVGELADLLYDFLPGNPHPYANQQISFPGCAHSVGLGNFWGGGSKKPAITNLLLEVLTHQPTKFCSLILKIVQTGILYRNNKGNPISRESILELNELIRKIGYKIPELWAPDFISSLSLKAKESNSEQQPHAISKDNLIHLRREFIDLASVSLTPQQRGFEFEKFLNKFFDAYGLTPRNSFRIRGEQIDGSFQLSNSTYLVEAKWGKEVSQDDLLIFRGKIEGKSTWSRGMMISYGGFSKDGLEAFKVGKSTNMIGMDSIDMWAILDEKVTLSEAIEFKARRAAETNDFFVSLGLHFF